MAWWISAGWIVIGLLVVAIDYHHGEKDLKAAWSVAQTENWLKINMLIATVVLHAFAVILWPGVIIGWIVERRNAR